MVVDAHAGRHLSQAARQAVVNHGKTAKQLVAEAEEGKRIAAHKDKFGVKVSAVWRVQESNWVPSKQRVGEE